MPENVRLLRIFLTTLKLGALTFGGGYAMVPLLERAFVRKNGWINSEDMVNMVALSQSVPGAIAINCGILIGYRLRGVRGALAAVAGIVLPSLVLLTAVTYLYEAVRDDAYVAGALRGIRASVVALLVSAFVTFMKPFYKDVLALLAFGAAFLLALFAGVSSIYIILGGILFGLIAGIVRIKKQADTS